MRAGYQVLPTDEWVDMSDMIHDFILGYRATASVGSGDVMTSLLHLQAMRIGSLRQRQSHALEEPCR